MPSHLGQAEYILQLWQSFGLDSGVVFEAGAAQPDYISNSLPFIDNGWHGLVCESDSDSCQQWLALGNNRIEVLNEAIPYLPEGLDLTLKSLGAQTKGCDVLFLDIDGGEFHLLEGMSIVRPRLICVEHDNSFPINFEYVPRFIQHARQSSSAAMVKMMRSKGYLLLRSFFQDLIFIEESFANIYSSRLSGSGIFGPFHAVQEISRGAYSYYSVLVNQEEPHGDRGVSFYRSKMEIVSADCPKDVANFFCAFLYKVMLDFSPVIEQLRSPDYYRAFASSLMETKHSFIGFLLL